MFTFDVNKFKINTNKPIVEPLSVNTPISDFKKNNKITICFIGKHVHSLIDKTVTDNVVANDFDIINLKNDTTIYDIIKSHNPHVFVTFGSWTEYKTLCNVPYDLRKRWINIKDNIDDKKLIEEILNCYTTNILDVKSDYPLISVFTCAYNTKEKITRPFASLQNQTYKNWEWIIVDDSDDNTTYELLNAISKLDHRVKVFKPNQHNGSIGQLKKWAAGLSNGEILVELDHDDELTNKALDYINKSFKKYEDVGFVYSNFSEIYEEDNKPVIYQQNWGLGYGSVYKENYKNIDYQVCVSPKLNCVTIRHIACTPNHVRAWRKKIYDMVGGHNPNMFICDDYELLLKIFMVTKIAHLNRFCYIQYRCADRLNTGMTRQKETHRQFDMLLSAYDNEINRRLIELNIKDLAFNTGLKKDNLQTICKNQIKDCSIEINDL